MKQLVGVALTCALSLSATACKQIEESSHCRTICEELHVCIDDDLSVSRCRDKCVDALDDERSLRHAAERCSDCIDDNACLDIPSQCHSCDEVLSEFTDRRFSELISTTDETRDREGVSVSDKQPESPANPETTDSDAGQ
ncbi:MAG: hypothetical protein RL701_7865 [Pseudomonadota bacterium]